MREDMGVKTKVGAEMFIGVVTDVAEVADSANRGQFVG